MRRSYPYRLKIGGGAFEQIGAVGDVFGQAGRASECVLRFSFAAENL